MKCVLFVLIAVIATSLAVDVDKCLKTYKDCLSDDDGKQKCIRERESGKFYWFDSKCDVVTSNCFCGQCVEEVDDDECNKDANNEPSATDSWLDKCIEKYKKCPPKKLEDKGACVMDKETGEYHEVETECNVESTNCMCHNCVKKVDDSKCRKDNGNADDDKR